MTEDDMEWSMPEPARQVMCGEMAEPEEGILPNLLKTEDYKLQY